MALPSHIVGEGTPESPYILTCWKDLYSISSSGLNLKYYKFVDNYVEDLSETYPDGYVPRVHLTTNTSSTTEQTTNASEIDFNNAVFSNGRFDGFRVASCRSSDKINNANTVLKKITLLNIVDTGNYDGIIHNDHSAANSEWLTPITLDQCYLEIEGSSQYSGLLNRAYITRYTGYSYIKRSNIILKGSEIIGASWNITDTVINFKDVILSNTIKVDLYNTSGGSTVHTYAGMWPEKRALITQKGDEVLAPYVKDVVIFGSVRTDTSLPTALMFNCKSNVILDIECDQLILYAAQLAVAYNKEKTELPSSKVNGKYVVNSEFTVENVSALTLDEIKDTTKLYEAGFPTKHTNI